MITNNIRRVFYHELGHLVAHEVNHVIFARLPVRSIKIVRRLDVKTEDGDNDYEGRLDFHKVDSGQSPPASLDGLPKFLAGILHGCIVQAFYHKDQSISLCLNTNGGCDLNCMRRNLEFNGAGSVESLILNVFNQYYNECLANNEFEYLISLEPEKYLEKRQAVYYFKIEELKIDLQPFIKNYEKRYLALIKAVEDLITKNTVKQPVRI
ncbi:hypothetical protein ACTJIJ_14975 [Niabella sp. 22666]|uniref:hypothetical protein n=1 Tax=Niabella sp. 22666 TaxID=3453954 RepID=UPI003F830435